MGDLGSTTGLERSPGEGKGCPLQYSGLESMEFMDCIVPGFSRPEFGSGQPFPSPGDLSNSGIKPRSPTLQADSLPAEPPGKPKNTGLGTLFLLQWILNPGIEPGSLALQVDSLPTEVLEKSALY